jgi:hypothetical protein
MSKESSRFSKQLGSTPLLLAALLFALGIYCAEFFCNMLSGQNFFTTLIPTYAIISIIFILLIALFLLYGFKKKTFIIICALIVAAGFLSAQTVLESGYGGNEIIEHEFIEGKVAKVEKNGENSIALILKGVLLQGEKEQSISGKVSLIVYGQSAEYLEEEYNLQNSVIKVETNLMYPADSAGLGFYDERLSLLSQRIFYKALVHYSGVKLESSNDLPKVKCFFDSIRNNLYGNIIRYVGDDEASLLKAIMTGDKSGLAPEIKDDFSRLGISHLLATSGLHIGILLLAFVYLLKKIHAPILVRVLVCGMVIIIFLIFAKFRISMVRAAFMWAVLMASRIFGAKSRVLNSLGAAMLFMLLINPFTLFSVSFVLSCSVYRMMAFLFLCYIFT